MNLLYISSDSKFVIRKYNIAYDRSNSNYSVGKEIIYSTEVLKSNLCEYEGHNLVTQVAFENGATLSKCIYHKN